MEAVHIFDMPVHFNVATWHYVPEDSSGNYMKVKLTMCLESHHETEKGGMCIKD
jgi:hypothetical protein